VSPSGTSKHKLALKGATIMNSLTRYRAADLPELMEQITRNSIGLDNYFDNFFTGQQQNYPPYNIVTINNVESRLEIALAGFKKDEVKVYTEYGKLIVEGKKQDKSESEYVHRGVAQRNFTRSWTLSDDTEVRSVTFEDGLLVVNLGKVVPEHHARKDYL
tara:strand:+ start:651 stop:1130 length:480 start_codon:yes stop_codon:yes gene_type:complete